MGKGWFHQDHGCGRTRSGRGERPSSGCRAIHCARLCTTWPRLPATTGEYVPRMLTHPAKVENPGRKKSVSLRTVMSTGRCAVVVPAVCVLALRRGMHAGLGADRRRVVAMDGARAVVTDSPVFCRLQESTLMVVRTGNRGD